MEWLNLRISSFEIPIDSQSVVSNFGRKSHPNQFSWTFREKLAGIQSHEFIFFGRRLWLQWCRSYDASARSYLQLTLPGKELPVHAQRQLFTNALSADRLPVRFRYIDWTTWTWIGPLERQFYEFIRRNSIATDFDNLHFRSIGEFALVSSILWQILNWFVDSHPHSILWKCENVVRWSLWIWPQVLFLSAR